MHSQTCSRSVYNPENVEVVTLGARCPPYQSFCRGCQPQPSALQLGFFPSQFFFSCLAMLQLCNERDDWSYHLQRSAHTEDEWPSVREFIWAERRTRGTLEDQITWAERERETAARESDVYILFMRYRQSVLQNSLNTSLDEIYNYCSAVLHSRLVNCASRVLWRCERLTTTIVSPGLISWALGELVVQLQRFVVTKSPRSQSVTTKYAFS